MIVNIEIIGIAKKMTIEDKIFVGIVINDGREINVQTIAGMMKKEIKIQIRMNFPKRVKRALIIMKKLKIFNKKVETTMPYHHPELMIMTNHKNLSMHLKMKPIIAAIIIIASVTTKKAQHI